MSGDRLLVVIGGPTASGKTAAAATLANHFGTEVISGDSRQFYQAMRIGTARPTPEEMLGVKHHFLGHLGLEQTWSAGEFARQAEPVLQEILAEHGIAILVGGSGLYLDALTHGLDPMPLVDHAVRERLQHRFQQRGLKDLLQELDRLDPGISKVIDRSNPHRVIRALEVCIASGRPYSAQRIGPRQREDLRTLPISLDLPRAELYARIDARVDHMIAEGLEQEARSLLPFRQLNALRTVGYREFFDHFDGKISRADAIGLIKQHTRNYAKRQLTWLRRGDRHWLDPRDPHSLLQAVENSLRKHS